jgi:molecular chaperone DnaK
MGKVVGIDLGTTNSCVAVMEDGKPTVIANAEGFPTTPSVISFAKNGDPLIGQIAKRQAVVNSENTFYSVKRFIGWRFDEITNEATEVAYKVLNEGNSVRIDSNGKKYAPEEISALVLRKLIDDASKYLGETVTHAVITMPAYFNDFQRQAIKDVGKIAGIEVLRTVKDPIAAALAYDHLNMKSHEVIMLVFDLSSGTLSVSLLKVDDGVGEILATSVDSHLGGDDFDKKIVDFMADDFANKEGVDLRKDRQALQRLTEAAEKTKIELSSVTQVEINLPFIITTQDEPKHLKKIFTRAKFEDICADLFDRCRIPIENAISDSKIDKIKIDEIILVGGSTQILAVQEVVKKVLSKDPKQTINPDEVVAVGAAVLAGQIGCPDDYGWWLLSLPT